MNKIMNVILIYVLMIFLISCSSGDDIKDVYVDMEYELYEYPIMEDDDKLLNPSLHVGKRYVLYFDIDFKSFQNALKREFLGFIGKFESNEVTINVSLGAIDDVEANLVNSVNTPDGGFPYNQIGNGEWEAKFMVTKTKTPDFSKTPFNIWINSVGLSDLNNKVIKVSMTTGDKRILINNSQEYAITLGLQAGNFLFTQENNLSQFLDYTGSLTIPSEANKISFTYYTSENKTITLGKIDYLNLSDSLNFDHAFLLAKLYYNVENPTMQQLLNTRNKILNGDYEDYFVRIEANGGNNYNNQFFEFSPFK